MCGRFTLEHSPEVIAELMGYEHGDERAETFPARYNISPTQPIVSVRRE
ncbi:MAG: SOS response-associated peptidase, partial [Rhizobiales bacterium]|nr:SOS response-associated peptidase [Hyphomicrobiales bacterium]